MTTDILQFELNEQAGPSSGASGAGINVKEGGEISLFDLLIALAERKRFILAVTASFALGGAAISLLLPSRYTATATILTPQQNTSMGAALAAQLGSVSGMASLASGGLSLKNPNDTYVGMLTSRSVEDAMVQHYNLMGEYHKKHFSDARKAFEKRAVVDGSSKDNQIRITIT
ncbi:MAG TPA: Wzz/FepE/Etk N-terminal domain-containing protein, partial [Terracidiphilus sp.]